MGSIDVNGDEFGYLAELRDELKLDEPTVHPRRRTFPLADGRSLSVIMWTGQEEPPDVVFLHGGAQNARTWDSTITALNVPAVAIDLAGHGHSSWRDDATYRPRVLAEDLVEVLPVLSERPMTVVGMSLGGLTAIALAAAHPEDVARLVVVDVTPGVGSKPSPNQSFVQGPESFASVEEILDRAVTFYPGRSATGLRRGILNNARQREDGRWVWRHHFGNLPVAPSRDATDLWPSVGRLSMPVTLVLGGKSWVVDEADLSRFRQLCPQVQVEVVPGAGHTVQGSHPAQLAEIVSQELARWNTQR